VPAPRAELVEDETCDDGDMRDPECVVCRIVAGDLPARFLYADETVVSFLDIAPATPGHALVVPRVHRRDLWEIEDDELAAVNVTARKVAAALRDILTAPGMWLHHVSGEAAGQDVFHFHLHVIPRYAGDTVQPGWGQPPWSPPDVTKAHLDSMAARASDAITRHR
jgi:histidine triad (HIT) family protein